MEHYTYYRSCSLFVETPYLIEWVEFHRLQGVDKFVLYHDAIPSEPKTVGSILELELLASFYRDSERRHQVSENESESSTKSNNLFINQKLSPRLIEDIIEIQSASMLIPDLWPSLKNLEHNTMISHRLLQPILVSDCVERYRDRAEYIMHIDVDEFVYSPNFRTVWDFLQSAKSHRTWKSFLFGRIVGFYIQSVNFGSSGQFWDFHNFLAPDFSSGTINSYFDPRHSTLFRYLQQFNHSFHLLTESQQFTSLDMTQQLDKFRTSRLKELSGFLPMEIQDFAEFLHQRLINDFSSKSSIEPFIDSFRVPSLRSTSQNSELKELERLVTMYLNQILANGSVQGKK